MSENGCVDQKSNPSNSEVVKPKHEPTYKVLTYFKNKPSVAFTCVSALVIVLSFLANAAIYLRESAFLKYWDIDVLYASVSSPNQLYRVCGNVVFAICVMLAITIINGAYEAYIPTRRLIISFTEIVNSNKKEVEKVSKDGKRAISRARKFRRKHPEKRVKGQAQKMREVEKSNKETLSKALALYEEAKKIARSLSKEIIVHFVVAGIIVTVGYSLFALLDSDRSVNFWVHVIADCVTLSILFLGCLITHRKEINKREIRQNAYDSIPQHVEDLLKDDHEYPLKKKWSTYFSDSAFIAMLVSAVVYTVFFLFAFNSLGHTAAISKNDFSIINYEDTTYAVIYNTGETVILEQCLITDSEGEPVDLPKESKSDLHISVYTDMQRIISVEGLEYQILDFKEVNSCQLYE